MNKYVVMVSLAVLLSACGEKAEKTEAPAEAPKAAEQAQQVAPTAQQAAAPAVDQAALTEEAKSAVQALGGTLKGELEAAMKAGGPVEAMSICNTQGSLCGKRPASQPCQPEKPQPGHGQAQRMANRRAE